ncbi:hypothetical protein GF339_10900 [candidate division KSB3 bacterium]|uniref:Uncharacterized protein n=1 Tax=candidate division KSB3 bacterium TaxID=2044937 RepID=A0A9D5JVW0_9BACT|nr:hypothetical protein [candidate division KSB3 bacterium]MBD3325084.1 hypothetical protein [candidate division KSB3 bacterium]
MNSTTETIVDAPVILPYIQEIQEVAKRGHKDESTENLLLAFVEVYEQHPLQIEKFIAAFLHHAAQHSLEFTPRAFRLSLLTAVKLFLRLQGIKAYAVFPVARWKEVLFDCLHDQHTPFIQSCLRDVSTVKIYRYIALQILGGLLSRSHALDSKGLTILDGGCSINIGLKCLNNLRLFQPIEITSEILTELGGALCLFPLRYAVGIDKYPPSLERTLASLFPSEVTKWEALYTHLYHLDQPAVDYQQHDILCLDRDPAYQGRFDVVFLSSLLRRFLPHQIADVLVQVNYATSPNSFLVINEQMSKETIEGGGTYATFILPKQTLHHVVNTFPQAIDLYELLHLALQLLVYPDENCRKVLPGKDFHEFLQREALV